VFDRWERALFRPEVGVSVEGYLRGSMGSSFRRCRSKRRALERAGEVTFVLHRGPAAVDALPRFLRLEASGWKGKNGTAMGSAPRHAAYAAAVVAAMSRTDDIAIAELRCGGRPVAMGLLPSSGGTVVFAKTAYDEAEAKYSPGVLLDMEITAALLGDPAFRLMDTGMDDSMPADGVIWSERRSMAHAIVALRGAPAGWIATGGLGLRQRMRAARRRYAHAWGG
jgi:CelD/BcsL family acetyltransferase involved in cellulose biosynthesis